MSINDLEGIDKKNNLDLETGTELSLAVDGLDVALKSTFVGKKESQYIVITPPSNFSSIEKKLLQSDRIKIKFSFKGNILKFTSKLMEITNSPLKLLLLEYPASVVKQESRSHKRISCFISAKIDINNETKAGVIKNISKRGCCCVFEAAAKTDNTLRCDDLITMSFNFPGIVDRQEVLGKIKDVRKKEKQLEVRIEFADMAWWVPPYD
jgi:c-di-GMP-binding flagellar brake protein YcgR